MPVEILSAQTHPQLEVLSRRYAAAIDRRDAAALLSVFDVDATMRVEQPGRETGVLSGHHELRRIVEIIARWQHTTHLVAQGLYNVSGDVAEGEVYCTAHHFSPTAQGGSRDLVMYIRYQDRYRLGADGCWLITSRTVGVDAVADRHDTVELR